MDYEAIFASRIASLRAEGRYRVFCGLAREAGAVPHATHFANALLDELVAALTMVWGRLSLRRAA